MTSMGFEVENQLAANKRPTNELVRFVLRILPRSSAVITALVLAVEASTVLAGERTTIPTAYGPLQLSEIEFRTDAHDRYCHFAATVGNSTGIRWTNSLITITVSGYLVEGIPDTVTVPIELSQLPGTGETKITAPCSFTSTFLPSRITATLSGTPNESDIAKRKQDIAARKQSEEQKRAKEAKLKADSAKRAADHAAFIASLPILWSSTAIVFLASDRKCLEEFLQASATQGLEKRKRLAELLSYECGSIVSRGIHVQIVSKEHGLVLVDLMDGDEAGKSGWVSETWLQAPTGANGAPR